MDWWAKACEYKCVKLPSSGLYDDQKYLDFLHSKFENIGVLSHRGSNIAEWNQIECRRTLGENNKVLINDKWEIVFIHFARPTIKAILLGNDLLLRNYLIEYRNVLKKYDPDILDIDELTLKLQEAYLDKNKKKKSKGLFEKIRAKLRLKTRLKKFIEG
jgi:hypothetical protein